MSTPAVRLESVSRRYGERAALADVDLVVAPGERVAVLGASGAGKSTLLGLLNGSVQPSAGSVQVLGEAMSALAPARLRSLRRRVGTVSQRLDLVDQVRVVHNVNAGRLAGWSSGRALWSLVLPRADAVVSEALERVGLGWAAYEPTERLSGGERQRVALARLLVQSPELVVADEPVASLDPARAREMLGLLAEVSAGGTLVVSLHQPDLARALCTRVVGLRGGRLVVDRPAADVTDDDLAALYSRA